MDESGWVSGDELLALAAPEGGATARVLELWRSRGLLPRPQRMPGGRAIWAYPPGTDRQLIRLLQWRKRTHELELVRVALWVEGFPVELESVRRTLSEFMARWTDTLGRERPRGEASEVSATVDALAKELAGRRRGRAIIPRVVRMTAVERQRAYGYFLAVMFGLDDEVERRKDDVALLERMLGLRSGHSGGLAAAMPFHIGEERLVRLPPPAEIKLAISEASEEEFEFVRRMMQITLVWFPAMLPLLVTDYGAKAEPFVRIASDFFSDPPAGFYPLVLAAFLASLHAKAPVAGELRKHTEALAPGRVDLEMLLSLPKDARRDALGHLPESRKKLITAEIAQRGRAASSQSRAREERRPPT